MMLGEQSEVDRCIGRVGERDDHRERRNGEIPTKGQSAIKSFVFSIYKPTVSPQVDS